jgi:hypothetical protein
MVTGRDPLLLHYGGTSWARVAAPAVAAGVSFDDVDCVSASDCWAVGDDGSKPLAAHWDGASWSVVTTPRPDQVDYLGSITCVSESDCWMIVTNGLPPGVAAYLHWNGTAWRVIANPADYVPGSIRCVSADECWSMGTTQANLQSGTQAASAELWNGALWTDWFVATPPPPASPTASAANPAEFGLGPVACAAPTHCFAVGQAGLGDGPYAPLIEQLT